MKGKVSGAVVTIPGTVNDGENVLVLVRTLG
ncbi:hypothetical protein A2U01_0074156, partial [Trifolium medium]|nr:hypothetical protein [Trifolium medium]